MKGVDAVVKRLRVFRVVLHTATQIGPREEKLRSSWERGMLRTLELRRGMIYGGDCARVMRFFAD
jgi:hypothetical protein